MEAITIDGKKYVPVDERIKELHRRELDFSLTSTWDFIPVHNLFVVKVQLQIRHATWTDWYEGTASKGFGVGIFKAAAVSWAETIARGRAIGVYLAPALAEIGAELVSAEEVHKEESSGGTSPLTASSLTEGALTALKNRKR